MASRKQSLGKALKRASRKQSRSTGKLGSALTKRERQILESVSSILGTEVGGKAAGRLLGGKVAGRLGSKAAKAGAEAGRSLIPLAPASRKTVKAAAEAFNTSRKKKKK